MNKIIILLIFNITIGLSQTGWVYQYPYPHANNTYALSFINKDTGYVASGSGTILKTKNNGFNWQVIHLNIPHALFDIHFPTAKTGYAVGDQGTFAKTTDYGNTWIRTVLFNTTPFSVYFINENTGYIAGSFGIKKTVNGGNNWISLSTNTLTNVYFLNEQTGFTNSLKTTNGGINWFNIGYSKHHFLDNLNGFAGLDNGNIYKTTNGGLNWIYLNNVHNSKVSNIFFLNLSTGYVYYESGIIAKTTNGGLNFIIVDTTCNTNTNFSDMVFTDNQNGFICNSNGLIYKTSNSGINWSVTAEGSSLSDCSNNQFSSIVFLNVNTGFAMSSMQDKVKVFKTTNSGANWTLNLIIDSATSNPDITKINETSAIFGIDKGKVYKTSNSGNNWQLINTNTTTSFYSSYFINQNTGFLGSYDLIFKSTNSGINWTIIDVGPQQHVHDIYFINNQTGFAVSTQGNILKTIDSGNNWSLIYSNLSELRSIKCFNNVIYAGGGFGSGVIIKSTDLGLTWSKKIINLVQSVGQFYLFNENNAIACISGISIYGYGALMQTTNGGVDWLNLSIPLSRSGNLYFIDNHTGWICGPNAILKTTNGGNPIGLEFNNQSFPNEFILLQNYPNPFNPLTTIYFYLPNRSNILLKVFDLNGKEIEILLNDILNSGIHNVDFDGSDYASGVYFIQLTSGRYTQTKKMVLIK